MPLIAPALLSHLLNAADNTQTPANRIGFVGLHSASPGATGANEISGGGYARQAATWTASSAGGAKTNSGTLTFTTTGAVDVTHACTHESASGASTYPWGIVLTGTVRAANIIAAPGALALSAA